MVTRRPAEDEGDRRRRPRCATPRRWSSACEQARELAEMLWPLPVPRAGHRLRAMPIYVDRKRALSPLVEMFPAPKIVWPGGAAARYLETATGADVAHEGFRRGLSDADQSIGGSTARADKTRDGGTAMSVRRGDRVGGGR